MEICFSLRLPEYGFGSPTCAKLAPKRKKHSPGIKKIGDCPKLLEVDSAWTVTNLPSHRLSLWGYPEAISLKRDRHISTLIGLGKIWDRSPHFPQRRAEMSDSP
jgi:hypothetical protein